MKISILTHRLGPNYGGILQAYALQNYLEEQFYCYAETTHLHPGASGITRIRNSLAQSVRTKKFYLNAPLVDRTITKYTDKFVQNYIKTGNRSSIVGDSYDLWIVGSDQVWRASYVDPIDYTFGFLKNDNIKRISYAASFGTDNADEYSRSQIIATKSLVGKFSGVSVREESGVELSRKLWDVDALWHIDPTMLLDSDHYEKLINSAETKSVKSELFVYVLDRGLINDEIVRKVEKITGAKKFELLPRKYKSFIDFALNKDSYIMPGVEQWLRSFRDAKFVVTDSFHGTVFSIIFNKPFISIGNKSRGLARFTSLLSMFGLEDRLVTSIEDVTEDLVKKEIDWASVNAKIKSEQKRSLNYLNKYLG